MACTTASGGPPLSIDDPGTLDPGQIELIMAGVSETRDSGTEYLLPVLDVSFGLSPDVLLGVVITRAVSDPDDAASRSDFGPGSIGLKWRFLNSETVQMSIAPFFEGLLRDGAADRGIAEDVEAWVLPMQFQYDFPALRVNAEVRYAALRDAGDEWGYGVAVGYPASERLELLAEVHGGATRRFNDETLLYRVGADYAWSDSFHVLVSAGSSISEPGDDDIDLQAYLGLQWFL